MGNETEEERRRYLWAIAKCRVVDEVRRRERRTRELLVDLLDTDHEGLTPVDSETPEIQLSDRTRDQQIRRTVTQTMERDYGETGLAVVWGWAEGRSYKELSREVGISVREVCSILRTAKNRLRRALRHLSGS